jgi:hypothetical protein
MFDLLTAQPMLVLVAILVVALMVWAVVKRLLKMALFLLLCLAALLMWLKLSGQEIPLALDKAGRVAGHAASGAVEKGVEAYRQGKAAKDSVTTH